MLIVSNGYCAELDSDGSWSRPPEDALEKHKNLDQELVLPPENHSRIQRVQSAVGYVATV